MSTTIEFEEDMEASGSDFGREALIRRVGALAKQRREELGLGRVMFAANAGLGSDATVRDFEFGKMLPSGRSLRKFEKALKWRAGIIDEVMKNLKRKASSIQMEELDEFDSAPPGSLSNASTVELLQELIKRLTTLESGLGIGPTQAMLDLAAMGYKPEHLEEDEEDEGPAGVNPSSN